MKLTRPSEVRALLDTMGFQPLKLLGQNFLIDENILNIILETADVGPYDQVLEIGPGLGVLTQPLLEMAARVVAVEKDQRLLFYLSRQFEEYPNFELIGADMLTVDHESLVAGGLTQVVSNLPYSVGSAILVNFFMATHKPERITVTLQQEVGDRLRAEPNSSEYGLLAIWSQMFYEVRLHKVISPTCFFPPPNVKSAILQLRLRERPQVELVSSEFFFAASKSMFGQRRKQLKKILSGDVAGRRFTAETVSGICDTLGISPQSRPESLSVEQWGRLTNALYRNVTC